METTVETIYIFIVNVLNIFRVFRFLNADYLDEKYLTSDDFARPAACELQTNKPVLITVS